ncbi:MAG: DUF362 domain-containing protein, partial [Planctomycetota bacterium]|nr:DUF362 domain-containing protein [Planctomycetota bacterium]
SLPRESHLMLSPTIVAVSVGPNGYLNNPPFSPSADYQEYPFAANTRSDRANPAYAGVRDCLHLLGLDAERFGKNEWNPLGEIVKPGQTVVLKPNFVRDFRETQTGLDDCVITHGSVIRAAVDYVYIALGGQGRIIIADAPQNDADFAAIRQLTGLDEIREFYRRQANFNIEVYDLRPERAEKVDGVITGHVPLPGDPLGYVKVDLGRHSMFAEIEPLCGLLYGSEYDTEELRSHHRGGRHEFLVSKTVLAADCVINLPKLKTHKKTGITACMKNLVGINGNKNWLPHHREGTPRQGGDQFANDDFIHRIEREAVAGFKRLFPGLGPLRRCIAGPAKALGKRVFGDTNTDTIRSGNWHGNDTTWRMVIDLNRILVYADAEGNLHNQPVRQVFNIVDGIVGGEGNGPLDPTPKPAGVVLAGANLVAADLVCARLMGFDWERLPVLHRAFGAHPLPLGTFAREEVVCKSDDVAYDRPLSQIEGPCFAFQPHFGWASVCSGPSSIQARA